MHFSTLFTAAGLAALTSAAPAEVVPRSALSCANLNGLTAGDCKILSGLGLGALGSSAGTAVGTAKGPNVWTVTNKSSQDIILVTWGPQGSWVNTHTPDVTHSLAKGASVTLSTPNGYSGAMSAIYGSSTKLVNGQVSNTWLEFTTGNYGVINVSREPNTSGNPISATITSNTNQQSCTSDFTKCFFTCANNAPSCWLPYDPKTQPTGFQIHNCATGSQPGAGAGKDGVADSGGCGGFGDKGAKISVNFM